jgi:hypothetical protein
VAGGDGSLIKAAEDRGPLLHEGIEPKRRAGVQFGAEGNSLGKTEAQEGSMKTVLIYVNTSAAKDEALPRRPFKL